MNNETKADRAEADRDAYRAALMDIDHALRVPAAEYVPAIQDAFQIIDRALRVPAKEKSDSAERKIVIHDRDAFYAFVERESKRPL
jgi:hypothetical protein